MVLNTKTMREAVNQHLDRVEAVNESEKVKDEYFTQWYEFLNHVGGNDKLELTDKLDIIGSIALNLLIGVKAINAGLYESIIEQSDVLEDTKEFYVMTTKIN